MPPPRDLWSLHETVIALDWILQSGQPCWNAIGWHHPLQLRAIEALVAARGGVVCALPWEGARWDMRALFEPKPGVACVLIAADAPPIDDVSAAVAYVNGVNFLRDRLINEWGRPLVWTMPRPWFDQGHLWAYDTWSSLALSLPLPPLDPAAFRGASRDVPAPSGARDVAMDALRLARRLRAQGRDRDASAVLLSIAAPSFLVTGREPLARAALALARGGPDALPDAEASPSATVGFDPSKLTPGAMLVEVGARVAALRGAAAGVDASRAWGALLGPALTLCLAEGPGAPLLLRCGTSVLHRRSVYGAWARQQRALQLREDRGGAVSEALPMAGEDADEALARWTAALEDVDLALAAADPARAARELELALASAGPGLFAGRTVYLLHSDDLANAAAAALVARLLAWHLSVRVAPRSWAWQLDADGLPDPARNAESAETALQRVISEAGPALARLDEPQPQGAAVQRAEPSAIVLSVHPDGDVAAGLIPELEGAHRVRVSTPSGPWHWRDDWETWLRVLRDLDVGLREVLAHPGAPLHVFMRGPYALGLRVATAIQSGRELHVWQYTPNPELPGTWRWEDWGPGGLDPSIVRRDPLMKLRGEARLHHDVSDVVLVVQVSRDITGMDAPKMPAELGLDRNVPVLALSVESPGQSGMQRGDLGRASLDFDEAIEKIHQVCRNNPTLHLILVAPLALAVAAGRKLHIRGRVIVYERVEREGAQVYLPILHFPSGEPAWPGTSPDDALARFLVERLQSSELRRLFGRVSPGLVAELPGDSRAPSLWAEMVMAVGALRKYPGLVPAFFDELRRERGRFVSEIDALADAFGGARLHSIG